ncbi:MAG TPA: tetratricopeptide repeat protein, partial [Vicinamibacterales bacterium]|nr:tetratricopeptide repeat protein [Vicinamibacterales bacterium]
LPKGTTLSMQYTYDNSPANARNPQQPPARARWGQRSSDEMGDLWIQVLTRTDADLETLSRAFRPKVAAEDVIGYEVEIEKHPDDAGLHDSVAMLYLELGRPQPAIAHFDRSAALKPQSPQAHYNLGTALIGARRLDEAAAAFRAALRLDPSYANAHNNLANVLLAQGRTDEAIQEFREVVRLQPDSDAARKNLAAALQRIK